MENHDTGAQTKEKITESSLNNSKNLTPSMRPACSHGAKLSAKMTSQAKKEFLQKLEEYRKAKRQTLGGTTCQQLKQIYCGDKIKFHATNTNKPDNTTGGNNCFGKKIERESVFERLYKNAKKPEKPIVKNGKLLSKSQHVTFNICSAQLKPESSEKIPMKIENHKENPENCKNVLTNTIMGETENIIAMKQNLINHDELNLNLPINQEESESYFFNIPNINAGMLPNNDKHISEDSLQVITTTQTCDPIKNNELSSEATEKPVQKIKNESFGAVKAENSVKHIKDEGCKVIKPSAANWIEEKKLIAPKTIDKNAVKPKSDSSNLKPQLRRSISMLYRKKKQILRTSSEKNLNELKREPMLKSPLLSRENGATTKHKPLVKMTPLLPPRIKTTAAGATTALRNKLEDWLQSNGHALDGYRHLRCFGLSIERHEPKTPVAQKSINSNRTTVPDVLFGDDDKENSKPVDEFFQPEIKECENWLKELYRLMVEVKYPSERCEEWLDAIRNKCPDCTKLPIYWECCTAFNENESRPKKEEVTPGKDSLVEVFNKMVIESNKKNPTSGKKRENGIDPENIFKSTVIKFAVQQPKNLKESGGKFKQKPSEGNKELVATPVRRSSRIKTPSKGVVNSLRVLPPDLSDKVTFKQNESLLGRL